jgi:hypothetical protein
LTPEKSFPFFQNFFCCLHLSVALVVVAVGVAATNVVILVVVAFVVVAVGDGVIALVFNFAACC